LPMTSVVEVVTSSGRLLIGTCRSLLSPPSSLHNVIYTQLNSMSLQNRLMAQTNKEQTKKEKRKTETKIRTITDRETITCRNHYAILLVYRRAPKTITADKNSGNSIIA